jgi:AraC-like DNA-binding protein
MLMTNSSWLEVRATDDAFKLVFNREGARGLGMRCANEAALAEMVQIGREISGVHVSPRRVSVRHPPFDDPGEHEDFFGCPLVFDSHEDAVVFDASVMRLPVLKADEGLSKFILGHLDQRVAERGLEPSLVESVRRIVCNELPGGVPKMEAVAKRVGMSKRTLQRRLGEHDTTFQRFVDHTRQDLADQLLRQTPQPLAAIAFLLGFSEQSAFQRAFKRWTGKTPTEVRAAA